MKVEYMRKKIKVVMLVTSTNLQGAEKIAAQLAYEMNEDYEVHFVVINEKKDNVLQEKLDLKKVHCHFYGQKENNTFIRKVRQLRWIFSILDKVDPDIIHVHIDYYFSWIYALVRKKRLVQTFHSQPFRIENLWTKNMYKQLYKRDLIASIVLTESLAVEFSEIFGIKKEELIVVPNFIDCRDLYPFEKKEKNDNRNKEIVFTFVARFHPVKNHHMLIEAFHKLSEMYPNCKLLLAGDGKLLNVEKDYVRYLKMDTKIEFLGEIVDISKVLERTDIFVMSSTSEAFPLALLEAMAFGLPVIVTDVGGMQDIVDGNGIKVAAGDCLGFANAMEKLALDSKLRTKYGQQSLELVKKYEVDKVVAKYKEIYMEELRRANNGLLRIAEENGDGVKRDTTIFCSSGDGKRKA